METCWPRNRIKAGRDGSLFLPTDPAVTLLIAWVSTFCIAVGLGATAKYDKPSMNAGRATRAGILRSAALGFTHHVKQKFLNSNCFVDLNIDAFKSEVLPGGVVGGSVGSGDGSADVSRASVGCFAAERLRTRTRPGRSARRTSRTDRQ
jgi:hypothetical protein